MGLVAFLNSHTCRTLRSQRCSKAVEQGASDSVHRQYLSPLLKVRGPGLRRALRSSDWETPFNFLFSKHRRPSSALPDRFPPSLCSPSPSPSHPRPCHHVPQRASFGVRPSFAERRSSLPHVGHIQVDRLQSCIRPPPVIHRADIVHQHDGSVGHVDGLEPKPTIHPRPSPLFRKHLRSATAAGIRLRPGCRCAP